jgi:hypothetical protein
MGPGQAIIMGFTNFSPTESFAVMSAKADPESELRKNAIKPRFRKLKNLLMVVSCHELKNAIVFALMSQ